MLDLIGAARPSIADPFLPKKIEEGRLDDIRECIGCNICVAGDCTMTPIRCTQNPTMGEEWRRGWHPERIRPKQPTRRCWWSAPVRPGLEAARGARPARLRGHAGRGDRATLGGRVAREARLPGLAAWIRVLRLPASQIERLPNVEVALRERVTADDVLEFGFDHVAVATGRPGAPTASAGGIPQRLPFGHGAQVLTPDDLMAGTRPAGKRVVLFDDDHYYMGGVLAELLPREGFAVTFVTPAARVSEWTVNTMEQERIQRRLLELGSRCTRARSVGAVRDRTACVYTGREQPAACDARGPGHGAAARGRALSRAHRPGEEAAGLASVRRLGDAWAPGTIAAAVWAGRRYAEEMDEHRPATTVPFRREVTQLHADPA